MILHLEFRDTEKHIAIDMIHPKFQSYYMMSTSILSNNVHACSKIPPTISVFCAFTWQHQGGKPYFLMDDLGGVPIFLETPKQHQGGKKKEAKKMGMFSSQLPSSDLFRITSSANLRVLASMSSYRGSPPGFTMDMFKPRQMLDIHMIFSDI